MPAIKKKEKINKGDFLFYSLLMIWPLAQFTLFYVYVNFNSVLYSFSKYGADGERALSLSYLIDNIRSFVSSVNVGDKNILGSAVIASLEGWVICTGISLPLGLLFSYYIGRKMPLAGAFRVILFLPSVICILVLVYIFNTFMGDAYVAICKDFFGVEVGNLLDPVNRGSFKFILIFRIFIGFGTSVLMFSNAVSEVPPERLEAGRIDGASSFSEFIHIVLPSIYPTMTVFLVTSVANILLDQFEIFSFYGWKSGNINTLGYLMYVKSASANGIKQQYPPVAAFGLLLTVIAVPTTLVVKYCLEKFGPSED